MPSSIDGTKVNFSNGTNQTLPMNWNVTYLATGVANGGSYTLPANCLGVFVYGEASGGGNNGGINRVNVYSAGGLLGYVDVNGTNCNVISGRNDGGSGMTDGAATFVPVPPNATYITCNTVANSVTSTYVVYAYVTR